jgi:hypothetical protein
VETASTGETPASLGRVARVAILAFLLVGCSVELAPLDTSDAGVTGGKGGTTGSGGLGGAGGTVLGGTGGTVLGGGSGGVAGSAGASGTGGSGGSGVCDPYCQAVVAQGCASDSLAACQTYCSADLAEFSRCATEYLAFLQCAMNGTWQCVQGYAQSICQDEWYTFLDCTWSFTPNCGVPQGAPSGGGCYAGHGEACNPLINDCNGGYVCAFSNNYDGTYECFPGPNTKGLCDQCNYSQGPFCVAGLECLGQNYNQCARFCCTDADCGGAPGSCIAVGYYSGASFCGSY